SYYGTVGDGELDKVVGGEAVEPGAGARHPTRVGAGPPDGEVAAAADHESSRDDRAANVAQRGDGGVRFGTHHQRQKGPLADRTVGKGPSWIVSAGCVGTGRHGTRPVHRGRSRRPVTGLAAKPARRERSD